MGKHSGPPTEETPPPTPQGERLMKYAAGITATVVAWGFLVVSAIDFGGKARNGQDQAWIFLFLATLGATACLFVTIILASKIPGLLRGQEPVKPVKAGGGRRASR